MKGAMSAIGTPITAMNVRFRGKADMATVRKLLALVMAAADMYRRQELLAFRSAGS
jgi:hypothetical protein